MKRLLIAVVVLILLTAACWNRVWADEKPQPDTTAKTSATTPNAPKDSLTDAEKIALEVQARKQAEGRDSGERPGTTVPEKHSVQQPSTSGTDTTTTTTTTTTVTTSTSTPVVTGALSVATGSGTGTAASSTPLTREQKELAEYKARAEAEKRDQKKSYVRVADSGYVLLPTTSYSTASFREPEQLKHNVALVYAPGPQDRDPAVGIQWTSPKRWGLALWGSGDLIEEDNVIDTVIPHDDYYMDSRKGSYAVQALYSFGSPNTVITTGAGVCIDETETYAVSNVTGWKWNAGTDRTSKFAAMLGVRLKVSGLLSVQYGYDTVQRNFFGLTAEF